MRRKKHPDDEATGPRPTETESDAGLPDRGTAPDDEVDSEGEGEQHVRDLERGLDRALTRLPPG